MTKYDIMVRRFRSTTLLYSGGEESALTNKGNRSSDAKHGVSVNIYQNR